MGLLGLGLKLKNTLKTKKVSETITSLKGKYNVGSADKIKSKAAKSKLDAAKFNLERTFSKTDKSLKKLKSEIESFLGKDIYKSDAETIAAKLKKTTEETKRYLLNLPPKK